MLVKDAPGTESMEAKHQRGLQIEPPPENQINIYSIKIKHGK